MTAPARQMAEEFAEALAGIGSPRRDDISGEVAIVTGGSRGLGLLLARELARYSCPLVICARDAAELERAAERLRADGAQVTTVNCDLNDDDAPDRQRGRWPIRRPARQRGRQPMGRASGYLTGWPTAGPRHS